MSEQLSPPPSYAQVAVSAPLAHPLTYLLPPELAGKVVVGTEVAVPLGKKKVRGYVIALTDHTEIADLKEITAAASTTPRFGEQDLEFYRWAASYYHHPLGMTLREIIPPAKSPVSVRGVRIISESFPSAELTPNQAAILEYLALHGPTSLAELRRQMGEVSRTINGLIKKNLLAKIFLPQTSSPGPASPFSLSALENISLNSWQNQALEPIAGAIARGGFSPFLLYGVTGSGKTEIYLQAMRECLCRQKGVLYLVPEIALTPQLLSRITARFPRETIAAMHSGVKDSTRCRQWQEILDGETRIVVGARSAIFAPLLNPGLIIVDEEHDPSYKQDERLKYNARDLALVKGRLFGATVILGSATPDVQTYYNARAQKYQLLSLPRRVLNRPRPPIKIIDLKKYGGRLPFSEPLTLAIRKNLAAGGQTLLFLNRRGFHTLVVCTTCGYVFRCRNCSISLTQHRPPGSPQSGYLTCHHCGYQREVEVKCPDCQGSFLHKIGIGTERVEEELSKTFPSARIARMDRDSVQGRDSHGLIMKKLADSEIDILIGTQMITKGHDFPGVTLIGVILADISLNLPDFRAAERTWQLMTQVAGRAGRGEIPGQVLIQTFNPEHYALTCAQRYDFESFYEEEIRLRRPLAYPPFSRLVNFHISSRSALEADRGAVSLGISARELCRDTSIEVLGPAPSPLEMIKGRHRRQLMLKGRDSHLLHKLTSELLLKSSRLPRVKVQVDVDPVSFM